jgi:hypothetical protein
VGAVGKVAGSQRSMRAPTGTSASKVVVLSRCAVLGGILQSRARLTAMKAHVSQLPIGEFAQEKQSRLTFAMSEKGRDTFIEQVRKPSEDGAGVLPSAGCPEIAGVAVYQCHRRLPSVWLLFFLQHADSRRRKLSETADFSSRDA